MHKFRVDVEGKHSPDAKGSEFIILGWSDAIGAPRIAKEYFNDEWSMLEDPWVGVNRRTRLAAKTTKSHSVWSFSRDFVLYVLAHAWSGLVTLDCDGRNIEVDLFSAQTQIRRIDATELTVRPLSAAETDELLAALSAPAHEDLWRLSSLGSVVIEELWGKDAELVDPMSCMLTQAPQPFGVDDAPSLSRAESGGCRLNGEAYFQAPHDGTFVFRSGPSEGDCVVEVGGVRKLISLRAKDPGRRNVTAGREDSSSRRHFLLFDEDRSQYATLLSRIDPNEPVAIYVPRWKGIVSSTRNLFSQCLPIPLVDQTVPESVTDADVRRYTELLLSSGASHFVISGGDSFFIRIVQAVHAVSPDVRFDLIWHSNYVQMGEYHDWQVLRQWLAAYNEGWIARIGVVKEGLDAFLRASGVDAIFIKNVIAVDPESIRPSEHNGAVGIWLSGSSDYRKLPHAALLALAQLNRYPLKASGLNMVARRLASNLNVPISRIWPQPIPHAQLYREMADTAATLYVTLSECSPMLPLESFALGVPCLVGPASHLFRYDPYLRSRLVVVDPLDPSMIARMLESVLAEREPILDAYRVYAAQELAEARESVARLLS